MPFLQMSVAWVLADPVVTALIIDASRPEQLAGSLSGFAPNWTRI